MCLILGLVGDVFGDHKCCWYGSMRRSYLKVYLLSCDNAVLCDVSYTSILHQICSEPKMEFQVMTLRCEMLRHGTGWGGIS